MPGISEEQAEHLMGAELPHVASGENRAAGLGMLQTAATTVGAASNPDRAVGVALQKSGSNGDLFSGDGLPVRGGPIDAAGGGSGHDAEAKGQGRSRATGSGGSIQDQAAAQRRGVLADLTP